MNRFSDIDLTFKRLSPVYGYHSEKIVSLEKALERIESEIEELPRYIKLAKRYCHFPSEHDLTRDQSASIYIYTMEWGERSLYRVLNEALRSENRDALKIWFPYLKLFDTTLDKLPTYKDVIWRGISVGIGKNFTKNQLITWWSINSCSSSLNVIQRFIGNNTESTLFLIEAINGKKISGYTQYETEDEVILRLGTQFRVKADPFIPPHGSHVVHLVEIDDNDDETLASNINQIHLIKNISGEIHSFSQLGLNTRWVQNGITIAGGNGEGSGLDQLHNPDGIYVDDGQTIYISDYRNDRILSWKCGSKNGQVAASGNGEGKRTDQLYHPTDIFVDKKNDYLIVNDYGNRRVMLWSLQNNQNGQVAISNIACGGLTMDNNGYLYVSDKEKHEVRKWRIGDSCGRVVAGGNGKGNRLTQLDGPTFIVVDKDYSVYVSDCDNHRVVKWIKGAKEGIIVAGGRGQGDSLKQFYYPQGLTLDQLGQIYVADSHNNRVMRWNKDGSEGNIVLGGNGKGKQSDQLHFPSGLSFDQHGNLYVADWGNHRIQKFQIDLS